MTSKTKRKVDVLRSLMSSGKLNRTVIQPTFEYRIATWGNCSEQEKEVIEVQGAALRTITRARKGKHHIEKLHVERRQTDLYKIQTDQCPSTLKQLIRTRQSKGHVIPSVVDPTLTLQNLEHR